jgi:hypothetical protein
MYLSAKWRGHNATSRYFDRLVCEGAAGGAAGARGQGCHHWPAGSSPVASKPDAGLYAEDSLQYNRHDSLGHCEEPSVSVPRALAFTVRRRRRPSPRDAPHAGRGMPNPTADTKTEQAVVQRNEQ